MERELIIEDIQISKTKDGWHVSYRRPHWPQGHIVGHNYRSLVGVLKFLAAVGHVATGEIVDFS